MTSKTTPFKLEKGLQELEQLVEKMEEGDLPLEKSLALFEKGIKLVKQCQTTLESAEQKIQILLKKHGSEALTNYDEEEE